MGMYFQDDFWEAAKQLPKKDRPKFVDACVAYYFDQEEPSLTGATMAMFILVRDRIDLSRTRTEAASKQRTKPVANGEQNASKTGSKTLAKPVANGEQNASTATKEREGDINPLPPSGGMPPKRFSPPTPSEIEEYARSKNLTIDAKRFCDFYASKGWKVGSTGMKDWKAAVRNWCRRDKPDTSRAVDFSAYEMEPEVL